MAEPGHQNDWPEYKQLLLDVTKRLEASQGRMESAMNRLETRISVVESNIMGYTEMRLDVQSLKVKSAMLGGFIAAVVSAIVSIVARAYHL